MAYTKPTVTFRAADNGDIEVALEGPRASRAIFGAFLDLKKRLKGLGLRNQKIYGEWHSYVSPGNALAVIEATREVTRSGSLDMDLTSSAVDAMSNAGPRDAAAATVEGPIARMRLAGNSIEITLGGAYAGPEIFGAFRRACGTCKTTKRDGQFVNMISLADAEPVLDAMRNIDGLAVDVDSEIIAALRGRAEDVMDRLAAARERLAATDEVLAERNMSLYPYQYSGVEWLSAQDGAILADDMGLGKQHAVDTSILTPTGWRLIGNLAVGDSVIGSNGKATKVTGVFPQGFKSSFRVRFSDHSSVEAGPEHLWTVAYRRGGRRWAEMTLTTDDLRLRPKKGTLDLDKTTLYLPMLSAPVEFQASAESPVSPYLLGQLIANGSLAHGTPALASATQDWHSIRKSLIAEGAVIGAVHVYGTVTRSCMPGIVKDIRAMELGVLSREKHIPKFMLRASVDSRIALLQGLMDGDGSISKERCKVTYHTISERLADDVQELVECLGGIASIRCYDRHEEGKPTEYQVRIRMPDGIAPFRIPRKLERYRPGNRAFPCRTVTSVEYVRDVESVCISVDAEDHLYVTEHAILTHNTVQALIAAPQGAPILVISPAVAKGVWVREAAKWRPDLVPVALKGRKSFRWPKPGEMVVTNYDILSDEVPPAPEDVVVIADEAHALKNPKAKRTAKFRAIADAARDAGGNVWLLTATPLLGKPPELWSLLQAINRIPFSGFKEFARLMGGVQEQIPRVGLVWQWGEHPVDPEVAERLQPLMLRRMKTEVLTDLPAKRYKDITVASSALKSATRKQLEAVLKKWDKVTGRPDVLPPFELLSEARAILASAKIPCLLDLVEEYEEAEEPLVVFSAHRAPVLAFADRPGWAIITGDTSPAERTEIEDAFQRGELKGVAATIQAGGVAITLTHASNAIFVDLDWTPALNAQAEDRIYRIGQKRGVLITRLVAEHAIDERLAVLLSAKQDLIDASVDAARRGEESAVDEGEADRLDALADDLAEQTSEWIEDLEEAIEEQEDYREQVARLVGSVRRDVERQAEENWQQQVAATAKRRRVSLLVEEDGEPDETRRPALTNIEEWAGEGLQTLKAMDFDHAAQENFVGFNKADSKIGHMLASRVPGGLSAIEWALAIAIVAKYWRQIGEMPKFVEPVKQVIVRKIPERGQVGLFDN
jgi:hypothetical protein